MDIPGKDLLRGTLELLVLSLLAQKESYGYEIISTIKNVTNGRLELKEGSLYPVLYRLEDRQAIESFWQAEGRGNPRKYYRLTEDGRLLLEQLKHEWQAYVNLVNSIVRGEGSGTKN